MVECIQVMRPPRRTKGAMLSDVLCNVESLSFCFSSFLLKEETTMGSTESKVNTEAIQKEITTNPVMVYSKRGCGFCTKAKNLLNANNVEYKVSDLDEVQRMKPDEYQTYVNGLVYTSRMTSVPQIFICGKFIGGFTELEKLVEAKKLIERIEECTGENAKMWN